MITLTEGTHLLNYQVLDLDSVITVVKSRILYSNQRMDYEGDIEQSYIIEIQFAQHLCLEQTKNSPF